jgi:hypothetical protein
VEVIAKEEVEQSFLQPRKKCIKQTLATEQHRGAEQEIRITWPSSSRCKVDILCNARRFLKENQGGENGN